MPVVHRSESTTNPLPGQEAVTSPTVPLPEQHVNHRRR